MNSVTWELTSYEQHRKPHETLPGNTEIAVSPYQLHSDLQCPICLDILTNTMTTKECLHRFCSECITTALRNGNKECPTCRKKLVSHRSLRKDTTFDAIVAKIFPDRSLYDEQIQKRIAQLMHMKVNDRYGIPSAINKTSRVTSNEPSVRTDESDRSMPRIVDLQLKLHDDSTVDSSDLEFFTTKYFGTSTDATIDHLLEFLKIRYKAFKHKLNIEGLEDASFSDLSAVRCDYEFSIHLSDQVLEGHLKLTDLLAQNPSPVHDGLLELQYLAKSVL